MTIDAGTRLGPYEILALLGAGGMGEVYRARDTRLDRQVAIKVLPASMSGNPELRQRFEREAKTISSLNHPHICTLYDVGESVLPRKDSAVVLASGDETISFLVMELLEGETLADRLRKGPLPIEQVLRYGIEITEALDRAHRQGVVHRDLKPGNVMITKSGAKLLDFGLAKFRQQIEGAPLSGITGMATAQKHLTAEGTILGTFQYMAPEQLEGQDADARTDIFAFGSLLYEMVTGKRAFEGKTKTSLIAAIVDRDPPPITSVQPLSPPALERVIKTCLAKDPDDRWQTAHDVQLQLRWIADAGSQAGVAAPIIVRRKRRERLMVATALTALVAAALFASLWLRERTQRRPARITASLAPAGEARFALPMLALSPDGTRIAFTVRGDLSVRRIRIRKLSDGTETELAGTDEAIDCFWSPDSRNIAFFTLEKLKRISASGGAAQTLCDVETPRGGTWGPDGTIVFTPEFRDGLFKIPSSGGTPIRLTRPDAKKGESNHRWPFFLPDGKHLLFLAQRAEGGAPDDPSTIDVYSLESGERKEILRANSSVLYSRDGYILFWREKNLLAQAFDARRLQASGDPFSVGVDVAYGGDEKALASVSDTGALAYLTGGSLRESRLTWVDRTGKELGTVGEVGAYESPSISPDGKQIVFQLNQGSDDIWVFDLERKARSRVTVDPGDEFNPVWSPDGARIAYGSNDPPLAIWVVPASGGEAERVWQGENPTAYDWSRDDRILVGFNESKLGWGIGVVSMKDRSFRPLVQTRFLEVEPRFSPDAKWITYTSNQSGRFEVYAHSLEGGQRWQVSTDGGDAPRWSRDGREIYYLSTDRRLMTASVTFSPSFRVAAPQPLFVQSSPAQQLLRSRTIAYDVLNRDRFLIQTGLGDDRPVPITLVLNWAAEVDRK